MDAIWHPFLIFKKSIQIEKCATVTHNSIEKCATVTHNLIKESFCYYDQKND